MENKRIIIATVICFVILVGWQFLADKMGWIPQQQTEETAQVETQVAENTAAQEITPADLNVTPFFAPGEGKNIVVRTPLYTAIFHSAGGVLESLF